jgi:hypothetical protein
VDIYDQCSGFEMCEQVERPHKYSEKEQINPNDLVIFNINLFLYLNTYSQLPAEPPVNT